MELPVAVGSEVVAAETVEAVEADRVVARGVEETVVVAMAAATDGNVCIQNTPCKPPDLMTDPYLCHSRASCRYPQPR